MNRSETAIVDDVTVTVALPTIKEAQSIYGVKLASKRIQPVWLSVKNDSTTPQWFLPSGLDPAYYSSSEAAFAFYNASPESNRLLDNRFQELKFKSPVSPGSTNCGFVLVNLDEGFKAIDIDLISRDGLKSFSFIVTDPDFKADYRLVDFNTIYSDDELIHIQDEEALRRALEALPGLTTNAKGDQFGDPLNLVLIGNVNDIVPAFVRRNWHATEMVWSKALIRTFKSYIKGEQYLYSPISPLYFSGRHQDIGWQKARSTINERNHIRLWLSPIRFHGAGVFVGQISRDIGVKFTFKSPTISTHVIDPDVDGARRYFVEDMAYSQALTRIGYVKSMEAVAKSAPRMNLVGDPYYTDGLRAVLFFDSRPYAISDIEILDWEAPSGQYTKKQ